VLLQGILETKAACSPQKIALVCAGQPYTYAQLDASANRLAHGLRDRGVKRGDRVVVYLDNRVEAVVALFAAVKADATFVAVHRATKERRFAQIVGDCSPSAIVTDFRAVSSLPAIFGDLTRCGVIVVATNCNDADSDETAYGCIRWEELQGTTPDSRPSTANIDLDLAALVYTSGTTGEPKGVMADHAAMRFVTEKIVEYLANDERDVVLSVLPIAFSYGLYQVLAMFWCGGTVVLENSFAFPAQLLKLIPEHGVTGVPGVPTMFAALLQSNLAGYDLTSLRYVTNAAAPLSPAHVRMLRTRLGHVALYSMYGMTEIVRALYLPPEWIDAKPDSVGIPIPGIEVWLEDAAGARVGPGEVGELVVRGRNVMRGYWRQPEATAARFRPGPLPGERVCYTGDLFRTGTDGCMYFVARKDDMLKCRGEKVSPKAIEDCLHELPGVAEAAVVGVADPVQGQVIKTVIVRSDASLDAARVKAHCKRHLDDVMVPTIVEFRDSLPRSPSGKVRKGELA
jgi:amino acid adenylation domain-containing protein